MGGIRAERGVIVIDDAYVCGFASRPGFLETCATVLRAVCDAIGAERSETVDTVEAVEAERPERPVRPERTAEKHERSEDLEARATSEDREDRATSEDRAANEDREARATSERRATSEDREARAANEDREARAALAEEICARLAARENGPGASALTGVLARIVEERVSMSASVQRLADSTAASRRDVEACVSRSTEEIHARVQRHGADVTGALARLTEERDATRKVLERVCALLDDRAAASNRRKGDEGEVGLVEVLEGTMTLRDGFTIHRVGTIPHNCDILVRKSGKPDVRIECKAHGKENGKPVATREVVRFEDDLRGLRNHGIFVSLYAPITGKAAFELRMLESNRVAVYLSNNHFDAAMIRDLVLLIYSVDELINADGVVLSPDQIGRIRSGLDDLSAKAAQIQTHLRASLELLSSMCFSSVARMLTTVQAEPLAIEATGTIGTAGTIGTVEAVGTVGQGPSAVSTVARVRRPYKKRGT